MNSMTKNNIYVVKCIIYRDKMKIKKSPTIWFSKKVNFKNRVFFFRKKCVGPLSTL